MKKRILLSILVVMAFFMLLPNKALAETTTNTNDTLTALKESFKDQNKVGEFDIKISVPGYEKESISGYNIIIVMDGSYSTDNTKWNQMRNSVINTVNTLLPYEDASKNINKVALISFGVDYHINIELTSDRATFANALPSDKGGSLLSPGRSATNNEAGLKGAREYIESLQGTELEKDKNHTYVIYLTDGEANLSEKPYNWYKANYRNDQYYYFKNLVTELNYAKNVENVQYPAYFDNIFEQINTLYDTMISPNTEEETTTLTLLDKVNKIEKLTEINNTNKNLSVKNETLRNIFEYGITQTYLYVGYNLESEYAPSDYERLFADKTIISVSSLNTYLKHIFYPPMSTFKNNKLEHAERAIAEGMNLKNYATIYTVGYGLWRQDAQKIMDPNYQGGTYAGYTFTANTKETHYSSAYYAASTDTINETLKNLVADITRIQYKNPTVIDYTSKWVNPMDINGDGIFNELDITITNNGQIVNDAIIKVEKLTKEEIKNSTDPEIKGNTNGDIYKITWTITDYLRSWDKYELNYRVKVDTQEYGFISKQEYKANGTTTLTYDRISITETNIGNETITEETTLEKDVKYNIVVPTVSQEQNIITITKTDEEGNLLAGADFDITTNEGMNQIVKEYSIDGINWTTTNLDNKATYFRFSGMYDFKYEIKETITPEGYLSDEENLVLDFTNQEGKEVEKTIINRIKDNVPQTLKETNYQLNLSIAGICLIGMIGSSKSFRKKKLKR